MNFAYDEEELHHRACRAYQRYCTSRGYATQQPTGPGESVIEQNGRVFVRLENTRGVLAVYEYSPDTDRLSYCELSCLTYVDGKRTWKRFRREDERGIPDEVRPGSFA